VFLQEHSRPGGVSWQEERGDWAVLGWSARPHPGSRLVFLEERLCNDWVALVLLLSCGLIEAFSDWEICEMFLQEHCGKLVEWGIA